MSQDSEAAQTAQDFIASQLQLEADAREALPYQFDTCTQPLGPLRQSLFSCLTCNPPPPTEPGSEYTPAGLCYSCSISCHGEHDLVELFSKRDFVCDCGTTRLPASAPCTLRLSATTGQKDQVTGEAPRKENRYNQNFAGRFCACQEPYDPAKEKGTMFQCLGLGHAEDGGCGEDWWHPECLMALPRTIPSQLIKGEGEQDDQDDEAPLPPGFPQEDDFDHLICYKCVDANPWLKRYASAPGFLGPVFHKDATIEPAEQAAASGIKRKAEEEEAEEDGDENKEVVSASKRAKTTQDTDEQAGPQEAVATDKEELPLHASLPAAPQGSFSLFLKHDFREHLCRCAECFPSLSKYPQLLEDEESYEPPMSESGEEQVDGRASVGTGSTYERGEALLSNMDRVKAIEGIMAYNHLKEKVKTFLQPYAESGQAVGAEDIKAYFAKLRGDDEAIKLAAAGAEHGGKENDDDASKEGQSGY